MKLYLKIISSHYNIVSCFRHFYDWCYFEGKHSQLRRDSKMLRKISYLAICILICTYRRSSRWEWCQPDFHAVEWQMWHRNNTLQPQKGSQLLPDQMYWYRQLPGEAMKQKGVHHCKHRTWHWTRLQGREILNHQAGRSQRDARREETGDTR